MYKYISNKIISFLGIVLFRLLLDINYVEIVNDIFNSSGFYDQMTILSYVISWIVLLCFIPCVIKLYDSERIFFSNVVSFLFLKSFVPATSLMAFLSMPLEFFCLFLIYWVIFFSAINFTKPFRIFGGISKKDSLFYLYFILISLLLVITYVSWKYTGFRLNFSLLNVYELRDEESGWNLPGIFKYLLPVADTILPVLLMYFWNKKNYIIVLVIVLGILLNFSLGGHKSIIFKLFLCVLGYYFYTSNKIALFSWFFNIICLFSLIEYRIWGSFFICSFIVRRGLFLPAQINYMYYDFFSIHEKDIFRQSFLRHFGFVSPYDVPIPKIIGANYMNNPETNVNNGLFSDAYYNLGFIGVFIFPIVIMFFIKTLDLGTRGVATRLLILPIIVSASILSGASFMSGLLTNGLLLLLFILFVLPKTSKI